MYRRILVAIDGSETSREALREALKLAAESPALLRLVHVVDETLVNWDEGGWMADPRVQEALHAAGKAIVEGAVEQARQAGIEPETALVETVARRVGAVIAEEAARWAADLIVIGTHGRRGIDRLLLGSVAEAVIRTAPVPVLLIRSGAA
ncbi:MAG: universal stress protein [Betaproteobacteria bacterium]|nr:universal stress protein [Betaproteobacteria bacterium]